jgi:DNA-3-methyladenine glycosylase
VKSFLEQDTVQVAQRLIGCHLIRKTPQGDIRVEITETEAYKGSDDPASHASRAMTPRNKLMFGQAGRLYVYLIYGMHYCMNVIAHLPGEVGAVLIRSAEPVEGIGLIRAKRPGAADRNLLNGPGKLAQGLGIGIELNGYDLLQDLDSQLRLQLTSVPRAVAATPRIGISKATELLWRFIPAE